MGNTPTVPFLRAYEESLTKKPLFNDESRGTQPLTFDDSLYPIPSYPFCTLGVLNAEGKGRGVAFVVEDSYLLTCASNIYSPQADSTITQPYPSAPIERLDRKVFIPKEYIELPKKKRDRFNYALLYIEDKPNLTDRYGSLGVHFDVQKEKQRLSYLNCALDKEGKLKLIGEHKLAERIPAIMDGGPIVMEGDDRAFGLTFVDRERGEPAFSLFNHATYLQLADQASTYNGKLNLYGQDLQQSDVQYLNLQICPVCPIKNVQMRRTLQGSKCLEIIGHFPFYSLQILDISSNKINDNSIIYLKNENFKNLKQLDLTDNLISPQGCNELAIISLINLRVLSLRGNTIGSQGYDILLKGNWPFLATLILRKCEIGTEGMRSLGRKLWPNLKKLVLGEDQLDNQHLSPFGEGSFPRIALLSIKQTNVNARGLSFLMNPSWASLKHINLKQSLLGYKGCKLIKQSKIVAVTLNLESCNIDNIGLKWLCKADLKKLEFLQLCDNNNGKQGCVYLSQAKTPSIHTLIFGWLSLAKMSRKGVKRLLLANWRQQILEQLVRITQRS